MTVLIQATEAVMSVGGLVLAWRLWSSALPERFVAPAVPQTFLAPSEITLNSDYRGLV